VVLLSARSRAHIERTHARYFKTAEEIAASIGEMTDGHLP
jgi:hypothetical protein